VLVVRGGTDSLADEHLERACALTRHRWGFDGISVFEAPDGDLVALARQRPVMATRRRVRVAHADVIRQAGFPLLDTGEELHWTVVFSLAAPDFFARLRAAFSPPVDNPGYSPPSRT